MRLPVRVREALGEARAEILERPMVFSRSGSRIGMGRGRAHLQDAGNVALAPTCSCPSRVAECGVNALGPRPGDEVFSFCKLLQVYNSSVL